MKTTTESKKPCGHGCKRGECVVCTNVNNPEHYGGKDNPYEAIKVIEAWELGFNLGNAVKYIARNGKKDNALQDLEKCKWYLEREISKLKSQNPIDEFLGEIGQSEAVKDEKIIVQWFVCSEEKRKMFGYKKEMIVIKSDHERFVKGTRFDFGFLQLANRDGFTVEVRP